LSSVALTALALACAVLFAPPASAASATPGDFSSLVPVQNPYGLWVDDCFTEVGVVVDTVPYPNYRHVGGVRVNCRSTHSVIDATVALYYWTGSRWVQYGNGTHGVRYNVAGSGYGLSGILRTPAYCVGSLRSTSWMVGTTVRTERTGSTFFSPAASDPRGGC
jgi:hypothetical protein